MAKGLSALQKTILQLTAQNARIRSNNFGVSNREVLIEYYGFEPCCEIEGKRNGAHIFDRKVIGIDKYKSASVAVVKAFNRLIKRHLAQRTYCGGILLTAAGVKAAKALKSRQGIK
jgi:hypothetical protein